MKNRLFVATRKGAFVLERRMAAKWEVVHSGFLGDNLSIITHDGRDGSVYVAAAHGHFGVKVHRSD
ncbi:MAG: exo-alpha-sialidase, partial [Planctomycetota bacterium]